MGKGKDSFGKGKDSFGKGMDSFGKGKDSFGMGKDSFGMGKDSFGMDMGGCMSPPGLMAPNDFDLGKGGCMGGMPPNSFGPCKGGCMPGDGMLPLMDSPPSGMGDFMSQPASHDFGFGLAPPSDVP